MIVILQSHMDTKAQNINIYWVNKKNIILTICIMTTFFKYGKAYTGRIIPFPVTKEFLELKKQGYFDVKPGQKTITRKDTRKTDFGEIQNVNYHTMALKYQVLKIFDIIMTSYLAITCLKQSILPEQQLRIFLSYLPQEQLKEYLLHSKIFNSKKSHPKHQLIDMIIAGKDNKFMLEDSETILSSACSNSKQR